LRIESDINSKYKISGLVLKGLTRLIKFVGLRLNYIGVILMSQHGTSKRLYSCPDMELAG